MMSTTSFQLVQNIYLYKKANKMKCGLIVNSKWSIHEWPWYYYFNIFYTFETFTINIKMEGQKRKSKLRNFRLLNGVCDSGPEPWHFPTDFSLLMEEPMEDPGCVTSWAGPFCIVVPNIHLNRNFRSPASSWNLNNSQISGDKSKKCIGHFQTAFKNENTYKCRVVWRI